MKLLTRPSTSCTVGWSGAKRHSSSTMNLKANLKTNLERIWGEIGIGKLTGKEKEMISVDETENVVPTPPVVNMPPRISIVDTSDPNIEENTMMFSSANEESPVKVDFMISAFELKDAFTTEAVIPFPEHVCERPEPRALPETVISGSEHFTYKWSVHKPAGDETSGLANRTPAPEDYADAFNAFKHRLIDPPSLAERELNIGDLASRGTGNAPATYADRTLAHTFISDGLYEIYCDVSLGGKTVTMLTFVQIGKPKLVTELPPILQAMPRPSMTQQDFVPRNKTQVPVTPVDAEAQVERAPEEPSTPPPVPPSVKKGI